MAQVQARRGEWLLATVAGLTLAALAAALLLDPVRSLVNLAWVDWHAWLLAAVLATALLEQCRRTARAQAHALAHGWLASTPWPRDRRRQALRRALRWHLWLRLTVLGGLGIVLLGLRASFLPPAFAEAALALPVVVLGLAPWLAQRAWQAAPVPEIRLALAQDTPARHLRGLALLQAAWTPPPPRSWRLLLTLGLLLLPADLGFGGGLLALLVVAALLWLGRGYARYRRLCAAAATWLAALPLSPARLLRALALPLLKQQTIVVVLLLAGARGAGLPLALLALALGAWFGLLSLSALLAFATRHAPRRYALLMTPRLLGLALLMQSLPPLAVLFWLVLVVQAARLALRPSTHRH